MKKIAVLLILLLSAPLCSFGEKLPPPWLPRVTRLKYEAFDKTSGVKIWKEDYTLSTGLQGGRKFLLINIKGEGNYAVGTFADAKMPTRWEVNSYYYLNGSVQPYYSKKLVYSLAGKPLGIQIVYYDSEGRKVYFSDENLLTGKKRRKTLDWYDDLVDRYAYAVILLSYPFAERRPLRLHYISDDPKIYAFNFSYAGKQKVVVPAGTFTAHKLKMKVDLGLLGLIGVFVPESSYFVSDSDPKIFLKYEGLEAGMGSPLVEIELQRYPEY